MHSKNLYIIDFRGYNQTIDKDEYNAIRQLSTGFIEGTFEKQSFERIQTPPQVWCFADIIPESDLFCSINMNCWLVTNDSIRNPFKRIAETVKDLSQGKY